MCDLYFDCEWDDALDWDGMIPEGEDNSVETSSRDAFMEIPF